MTEQPPQKSIDQLKDLEIARILTQQLAQYYQIEKNIIALQAELERREQIQKELPNG